MFQYAAGKALAHRLCADFKLDVSGFDVYRSNETLDFRKYGLGVFNVSECFASADDIELFQDAKANRKKILNKILSKVGFGQRYTYFMEKHFQYDRSFNNLSGNIYLDGYWNSELYFSKIKEHIRDDFSFKNDPSGKNYDLLNKIDGVQSVCIHVRRGDYVTNPKANKVHGVCDLHYYRQCAEVIAKKIDQPHCFIFSDDPEWLRANLEIPLPSTIVDHNGPLAGHEDMRLMSRCKHQVIANSTFSWWAAWLNINPDKLVLAPRQWFRSDKYNTRSLFPATWMLM